MAIDTLMTYGGDIKFGDILEDLWLGEGEGLIVKNVHPYPNPTTLHDQRKSVLEFFGTNVRLTVDPGLLYTVTRDWS